MKAKWQNRKGAIGIKVYYGNKYNYAYEKLKSQLLISSLDYTIKTVMQVKDFKTAKQIVECLER